ncbi:MAG: HAMP domain-containing protein [Deltaproteobacteria bacterium]|nr:HAMP domain-containing protein [Deltaproteobacteria bacterium]
MRLSLFSRLTFSYLIIFLLIAAVSATMIFQLSQFNRIAGSILETDNRILEYEKSLGDLLLSQNRYERKFAISRDESLFKQYLRLNDDFNKLLERARALNNPVARDALVQVATDHQSYDALVRKESKLLRANRAYPQNQFKEEKDKLTDAMLAALERLRSDQQRATTGKVRQLAEAADQATEFAIALGAACLMLAVLLAWIMTRSVTRSVNLLKKRTREIAQGQFESQLKIASPPEIRDLGVALNAMAQRLKEVDRMKSDFFATMSHELRTPLTSIKEGTGLLLDGVGGETTDKQRKLLTILAEESNRLIGLVNSLLDFSKMEAGMMSYEFEVAHVDPLVRRAISEITPLVEAKQIQLHSAIETTLPAVKLDPERILLVLRNLIGNAVKFTPKGGEVQVAARPVDGKLEISVKDSGPGIPAESLTTIFEKFNQGERKNVLTRQGTGLGLAIAKSIVKSHGGEIWAESQLGHGSRFVFVLPC